MPRLTRRARKIGKKHKWNKPPRYQWISRNEQAQDERGCASGFWRAGLRQSPNPFFSLSWWGREKNRSHVNSLPRPNQEGRPMKERQHGFPSRGYVFPFRFWHLGGLLRRPASPSSLARFELKK